MITKILGISNGPFLQQALHFFADWHLQFLGSRCFRKFASKWKGRFKGWSEGEEFLANGNAIFLVLSTPEKQARQLGSS